MYAKFKQSSKCSGVQGRMIMLKKWRQVIQKLTILFTIQSWRFLYCKLPSIFRVEICQEYKCMISGGRSGPDINVCSLVRASPTEDFRSSRQCAGFWLQRSDLEAMGCYPWKSAGGMASAQEIRTEVEGSQQWQSRQRALVAECLLASCFS